MSIGFCCFSWCAANRVGRLFRLQAMASTRLSDRLVFFHSDVGAVLSVSGVFARESGVGGIARYFAFFSDFPEHRFSGCDLVSFSTAKSEYWMTPVEDFDQRLSHLIAMFIMADKGISLACVTVLIAILGFIFWFPVKMSKNLAVFSVGFVIYFAAKPALNC